MTLTTRPRAAKPGEEISRQARGLATATAALVLCWGGSAHAGEPTPAEPPADEPAETEPGDTEEPEEPAYVSDLDSLVRVVQQRPVLKSGRFELFVGAGFVANDSMYDHWLATGTGRVHVSEWISIGATYSKFFSNESELQQTIATDYEVFPELSATRWYAGGDVTFVAVDGKFTFFDSAIAYWDIYASIGGGVTVTSRSDSAKPTGMVGIAWRLFLADWLTFSVELRDYIFVEQFNAGSELVNNLVGQAGITLFIPFGFDYEYAK